MQYDTSNNNITTTDSTPLKSSSSSSPASTAQSRAAQLKAEAIEKYGPDVVISPRTGKPKRRKANRACVHCQRTHLTCDNNRPCERCVQRGLAETCRDGTRKKAKYLQDVPDSLANNGAGVKDGIHKAGRKKKSQLQQQQQQQQQQQHPLRPPTPQLQHPTPQSVSVSSSQPQLVPQQNQVPAPIPTPPSSTTTIPPPLPSGSGGGGGMQTVDNVDPLDRNTLRNSHSFQSSAVNLEYKILSNILNGIGPGQNGPPSATLTQSSPSISEGSPVDNQEPQYHSQILNHFTLGGGDQNLSDILSTVDDTLNNEWFTPDSPKPKRPISFAIADHSLGDQTAGSVIADTAPFSSQMPDWRRLNEPADIYSSIKKPYSYTPGFHALIAYLKTRFNKEQLIKMAKCMARYRPSFIACTNTLKEDDLIFMEQCFQRTLMEYEKFIAFSGTPTLVWRRTGQVTAVGKEFCILTGWTRERLLDQRTFVVELMDDNSVLEYFEMFSNIAFGDSRATMMSECTLLTPAGQKIKTSCMWTLKRDVFGIPMMIIGNFLPILS